MIEPEHMNFLLALCMQREIDFDKIETYITTENITSEEITKTAIKLVDELMWEVDSFQAKHQRPPQKEELATSSWPTLFELLLKHGLEPNAVYCDDGFCHDNLLRYLVWVDNEYVIYDLFRLLLQSGGDPNVFIEDESLFEMIDGDVVMDATLMEIEGRDRVPYEKYFRLWLLLMSYGGCLKNGKTVLNMKNGYSVDVFRNCELFSYRKENAADDWYLHIYHTETGEEVAIL